MNHSFNKKFFDSMIKVVHAVLKWSVVALFVLMGLLVVIFVVTLFIPASVFDFDLAHIGNMNVNVMNVMYDMSGFGFSGIVNVKLLFLLILFVALGNLAFYQYIQIQLKKLMSNIKEGSPFNYSSAKFLRYMGIAFLIASVVLPILNGWLFMGVINTLEIFEASINFSLSPTLLLICLCI